jgi:hypothetical protein
MDGRILNEPSKRIMDMTTLTRQAVLEILQGDWATYVPRYRSLSPDAQAAFLGQQGYARFADLLSHIVAWWDIGYQAIESYLADPAFQPQKYDVDAFNAEAVSKVVGIDEDAVVEAFEKMRGFLLEFVKALPDTAFENEKVVNQFNMELVGHLSDHNIPEKE